jgi:hypothetical protein
VGYFLVKYWEYIIGDNHKYMINLTFYGQSSLVLLIVTTTILILMRRTRTVSNTQIALNVVLGLIQPFGIIFFIYVMLTIQKKSG